MGIPHGCVKEEVLGEAIACLILRKLISGSLRTRTNLNRLTEYDFLIERLQLRLEERLPLLIMLRQYLMHWIIVTLDILKLYIAQERPGYYSS